MGSQRAAEAASDKSYWFVASAQPRATTDVLRPFRTQELREAIRRCTPDSKRHGSVSSRTERSWLGRGGRSIPAEKARRWRPPAELRARHLDVRVERTKRSGLGGLSQSGEPESNIPAGFSGGELESLKGPGSGAPRGGSAGEGGALGVGSALGREPASTGAGAPQRGVHRGGQRGLPTSGRGPEVSREWETAAANLGRVSRRRRGIVSPPPTFVRGGHQLRSISRSGQPSRGALRSRLQDGSSDAGAPAGG